MTREDPIHTPSQISIHDVADDLTAALAAFRSRPPRLCAMCQGELGFGDYVTRDRGALAHLECRPQDRVPHFVPPAARTGTPPPAA